MCSVAVGAGPIDSRQAAVEEAYALWVNKARADLATTFDLTADQTAGWGQPFERKKCSLKELLVPKAKPGGARPSRAYTWLKRYMNKIFDLLVSWPYPEVSEVKELGVLIGELKLALR